MVYFPTHSVNKNSDSSDINVPLHKKVQKHLNKIDTTVGKLQKLWGKLNLKASEKSLENSIRNLTQDLDLQIKEIMSNLKKSSSPLTANSAYELALNADYLRACQFQLNYLKNGRQTSKKRQAKFCSEQQAFIPPGFRLVDAKGDGNCCLRSVAKYFANDEEELIKTMRAQLVKNIRKSLHEEVNRGITDGRLSIFLIDVSATKKEQHQAVDNYCNKIAHNRAWLGQEELAYLGPMINRPIWIYTPSGIDEEHKLNTEASGDPICLFHHFPFPHYDALLPEDK